MNKKAKAATMQKLTRTQLINKSKTDDTASQMSHQKTNSREATEEKRTHNSKLAGDEDCQRTSTAKKTASDVTKH